MKGTVFILEDDESICSLVKVALEMHGLNMGADDYIAKPFSVLELAARALRSLTETETSLRTASRTHRRKTMPDGLRRETRFLSARDFQCAEAPRSERT